MANKILYLMVSWQNLPVSKLTNNFSDEPLSGHNIFVLLTMTPVKYTLHAISFFLIVQGSDTFSRCDRELN